MVVGVGRCGPGCRHRLRGLGLGVLSKLLEGWRGAVLAKIALLLLLVLVIQRNHRPLLR